MRSVIAVLFSIGMLIMVGCRTEPRQAGGPGGVSAAASGTFVAPGPQADGAVRLPNQWTLRPIGRHVPLGDFPVNVAIHPAGRYAAVLHSGHGQHEVVVVDLAGAGLHSRVAIPESFYGLAFSPAGDRLYCSGAGSETIHTFGFKDGYLGDHQTLKLRESNQRGIPAGLTLARNGQVLYAANVLGQTVSEVRLADSKGVIEIQIGTNVAAGNVPALPAFTTEDEAAISKRSEALLYADQSADPFPYTCVLDEKRNRLYVSLWAQSQVAVVDLAARRVTARWSTGQHPNEMLLDRAGRRLFVANANHNTVTVLEVETGRTLETLVAELSPGAPPGNTPNSLALNPDESLLFVANANINAVAVFDIRETGRSRSLGFIPVGWYPTSVRVTPDGRRLLVANGKGLISKSNRNGPRPAFEGPATTREYIGGLMQGTLSIIDLPAREAFEEQMKRYTAQAYRCLPEAAAPASVQAGHPIPAKLGDPSPIKYVVYILKENRTYDQVLGDLPQGNSDPTLCIFPERITPNHHQLAREFVLLDNFYVESEVSADGHEWSVGAYATDFVEKTWPLSYGHNRHKKYTYPAEGNFPIAFPAGGYLWDCAREAGVSYRSYGEFVSNGKTTNSACTPKVAALKDHFDPWFRSFDMDYSDLLRVDRFISELRRFEKEGEMPRLQIVRVPNDHTSGTSVGKPTPTAYVAENDLALGRLIEALTHSRFWPQMAIFVVEDDAQNGSDHVDAHRTIAYAISPYTRRSSVDSTMYSTTSMLRTMELILGLRPMSQFDAAARPMYASFQAKPDTRPYRHLPANVCLTERNTRAAWGARESSKMNFAREDAADDLLLNDIIWRSVRGPGSPMPPPVRAAFVFGNGKEDDD
jgi:DNA-binding beta-propeller fold protein YncE